LHWSLSLWIHYFFLLIWDPVWFYLFTLSQTVGVCGAVTFWNLYRVFESLTHFKIQASYYANFCVFYWPQNEQRPFSCTRLTDSLLWGGDCSLPGTERNLLSPPQNWERQLLPSSRPSVCLSVIMEKFGSHQKDYY